MKRASVLGVFLTGLVVCGWAGRAVSGMGGFGRGLAGPLGPFAGRPGLVREFFPPQLVMRYSRAIHLSDVQRKAITDAMAEMQKKLLDLQWKVADASAGLARLVRKDRLDEEAVVAQAKKLMDLQAAVRQERLRMLVRIKNALSAEQQRQLRVLRRRQGGRPWLGRGRRGGRR